MVWQRHPVDHEIYQGLGLDYNSGCVGYAVLSLSSLVEKHLPDVRELHGHHRAMQ
jgi:hypothetical protein